MTRKSAGLLLFREASGRLEVLLVHPGGPASSLADACNRWGLKVPLFSERLQARVRELLPATGSFRNPVDLTFFMDLGVMMEKLPQIILEDPEINSLGRRGGFNLFPLRFWDRPEMGQGSLVRTGKEFLPWGHGGLRQIPQQYGKPVVASSFADREDDAVKIAQDGGIPCFRAPERAVSAMVALCRYGEIRRRS